MTQQTSPIIIFLDDENKTSQLGEDLALALRKGDCLMLSGEIGAGKSTLARALLRAMADDPQLDVPSPTFTLVQQYDLRIPVAHFDLYRLGDPEELHELGFEEMLSEGICLVEWPEMAAGNMPRDTISLMLENDGEGRKATIVAHQIAHARISRTLAIREFLTDAGLARASRRHLSGDASSRAYEKVSSPSKSDQILMDWPTPSQGPVLQDGKTYAEIAHIAREPRSFVAIAGYLRGNGFTAPETGAVNFESGMVLMNDLGSDGILHTDGTPVSERYLASVECLAKLHSLPVPRHLGINCSDTYSIPAFDAGAMKIEVSLLPDWYLPHKNGEQLPAKQRDEYFAIWDELIGKLESCEKSLVLRDFHSPNIIWQPDLAGIKRVGIIDFQDAMLGPTTYDLASLVQDARVDIPSQLAQAMLDRYLEIRRSEDGFNETDFLTSWSIMAAQRNCKLAGIWVRLKERDGKPDYMKHMPRTMRHLFRALEHPELARLAEWLVQNGVTADNL